jgi:hypothetical protein
MALKLKIGAFIDAPVRLIVKDGSRDVPFNFTLVLRRLSQDEALGMVDRLQKMAMEGGTAMDAARNARDLLADLIHDWRDQRLVLDDDDKPASYSPEALDVMLQLAGAGTYLLQAVMRAVQQGVREDDKDRRGN